MGKIDCSGRKEVEMYCSKGTRSVVDRLDSDLAVVDTAVARRVEPIAFEHEFEPKFDCTSHSATRKAVTEIEVEIAIEFGVEG